MLSFQCNNCGGEMAISRIGELTCPYCGTHNFFNDSQLTQYKEFRKRMLEYLSALAQNEETKASEDRLWTNSEKEIFVTSDGTDITIEYIYKGFEDGVHIYATRKNVILIYPKGRSEEGERAITMFSGLAYPQADVRDLARSFPSLVGRFLLDDGRLMIVCSKSESMYPVEMFGALPARHVEWIISRLENIACVMEYNEIVHGGITPANIFINPKTHEAALYGGWHKVKKNMDFRAGLLKLNHVTTDLQDIRQTAKQLLGKDYEDAPKPLINFINGRPAKDAYDDFGLWDSVIENELGGRHFSEFKI